MMWQKALEQIQSPEFDANVNVVSGIRSFIRAVDRDHEVRRVRQLMLESGELRENVLGYISDLALADIDIRYENPNDTPLAVLLWLTYYTAPEFSKLAAHYTAGAPNCWYAHKLARIILEPNPADTANEFVSVEPQTWNIGNSLLTASSIYMFDAGNKLRYFCGEVEEKNNSANYEKYVGALS